MLSDKNFIVYRASAGSGKTYTLVKEYLKIVLPEPEKYRHILAVTFTNKAAYEMKNRIMLTLKELSLLSDNTQKQEILEKKGDLINDIKSFTNLSDEQEIAKRSHIVFEKILHNYSDFAISTIDSFVQRIVRTFAYDLKIPQNFEIELDVDRVLSQAVDILISYAGPDTNITKVLTDFIKYRLDEGRSWDIEQELKDFAQELKLESTQKHIALFENYTIEDINKAAKNIFAQIAKNNDQAKNKAKEIIQIINEQGIKTSSFYQGSRGIMAFFSKVSENGLSDISIKSYYTDTVEHNKWFSSSADQADRNKIEALKAKISNAFYDIKKLLISYRNLYAVSKGLYPLTLLNIIKKETENIKDTENIIFIGDFYQKIHEQLLHEPVPYIYQRTGERYEHYFIDEFQDTSVLQFQNMLPLIDNSLANGNKNFIVGDGKQAIYRWRNGEVLQFSSLPKIFQKPPVQHFDDIEKSLERNFIFYENIDSSLKNINYRSKPEIIKFNNRLFEFITSKTSTTIQNIYSNLGQLPKPNNTGGYVKICFFEKDNYKEQQLQKIVEIIENLKNQNIPYKHIAVLCRTNKETSEVASFLSKHSIDIVSSESLNITTSAKINLLVSLLRFIYDPKNRIPAAFILKFVNNNSVTPQDINQLYFQLAQGYSPKDTLENLLENFHIHINFNHLKTLPLYDLCEELIRLFGLNKQTDPFVLAFLDIVSDFTKLRPSDIGLFLSWWDEHSAKKFVALPDDLDAVRISTIHKAKGLEFPVVIYPFADESIKFSKDIVWLDNVDKNIIDLPSVPLQLTKKNLEQTSFESVLSLENEMSELDMYNICYVALTRAEQQLYILTQKHKNDNTKTFGALLQSFLKNENIWDDNHNEYEFGQMSFSFEDLKSQEGSNIEKIISQQLISEAWNEKVNIKCDAAMFWEENTEERINIGTLTHKVLSQMIVPSDLNKIIQSMCAEGLLDDSSAQKIRHNIERMLENPQIQHFFSPELQVKTEVEILTPENKTLRPDRIIFDKDTLKVIEFKTGSEKPEHIKQVENYAGLLQSMTSKQVEKYLVYLSDEIKVMQL